MLVYNRGVVRDFRKSRSSREIRDHRLIEGSTFQVAIGKLLTDEQGRVTVRRVLSIESGVVKVETAFEAVGIFHDIHYANLGTCQLIITEARFGHIPRVYIECLRDKTLPPALQKEMYRALPCQQVISMNTSHSPFLSASEELAEHLTSLRLS